MRSGGACDVECPDVVERVLEVIGGGMMIGAFAGDSVSVVVMVQVSSGMDARGTSPKTYAEPFGGANEGSMVVCWRRSLLGAML